ncbi:MAG: hypothetical protein OXI23_09745 [Gemmatimonadota bacterium]|nr:hypothetical protein [Gemmatimonadota bacterium]
MNANIAKAKATYEGAVHAYGFAKVKCAAEYRELVILGSEIVALLISRASKSDIDAATVAYDEQEVATDAAAFAQCKAMRALQVAREAYETAWSLHGEDVAGYVGLEV